MGNTTDYRGTKQAGTYDLGEFDDDAASAERRLERLIALNDEFEREALEDKSGRSPVLDGVGFERTYAFLGLCLGLIPPAAFFLRLNMEGANLAMFVIGSLVTTFAALTGYFSGKTVGRCVRTLQEFSWPVMIAGLPFVGALWGIVSGAAGGAFGFLFGAIPGAMIGGAVGFAALPVFAAIHRTLKVGEEIERKLLIPTAVGVSSVAAAVMLGFPSW